MIPSQERQRHSSTFGIYVRSILVSLVCGMAGPIFLVVWFLNRDEPEFHDAEWMLWVGIGATAFAFAIGIVFARAQVGFRKRMVEMNAGGVPKSARIVINDMTNATQPGDHSQSRTGMFSTSRVASSGPIFGFSDGGETRTATARLAELDRLRTAGSVSATEYAEQRSRILNSL